MAYASGISDYPARSSRPPPSWRAKRLSPLELMWKALALRLKAFRDDNPDPLRGYRDREDFPLLEKSFDIVARAATSPGTTTTSGWASELVTSTARAFAGSLAPGVFGTLTTLIDGFNFDGDALPRVPSRNASAALGAPGRVNGSFIGEGSAIPVRRLTTTSVTLAAKKIGVLTEFTNELFKSSNIELVLRTEITRDTREAVDTC